MAASYSLILAFLVALQNLAPLNGIYCFTCADQDLCGAKDAICEGDYCLIMVQMSRNDPNLKSTFTKMCITANISNTAMNISDTAMNTTLPNHFTCGRVIVMDIEMQYCVCDKNFCNDKIKKELLPAKSLSAKTAFLSHFTLWLLTIAFICCLFLNYK